MFAAVLICKNMDHPYRSIQTRPEKFENAGLVLRLGLASILIRCERKRSLSKTLIKSDEFENAADFAS